MSTSAIGTVGSTPGTNPFAQFDPAQFLDKLSNRFLKKYDKDGDGNLSSAELSGLSSDAFKALDTNGDGTLGADEVKAALKKALDEFKAAGSASDPQSAQQALADSPEGQLLKLARPHHHHHGSGASNTGNTANQPQGNLSISSTTINVTINQTIYNINGSTDNSQQAAPASNLDVTA